MEFHPKVVNTYMEKHDLIRVVPASGETLIWRKKYSRYLQYRLDLKLVNRCGQESWNVKEHGRITNIKEVLEDDGVPARNENSWRIKEYAQDGALMAHKCYGHSWIGKYMKNDGDCPTKCKSQSKNSKP